ncbi:MAG: EAL domain-containing response regulator [Rhodospirillales bacterium]
MEINFDGNHENKRRLLVLDDDNDVAATICMMAETAGYEIDHTDDAEVFLAKVIAWSPTHVAVDLQLADQDGVEVLHKLAGINFEAAVIVISGLGRRILNSSARVATENGLQVTGILPKPISRTDLLTVLATDVRPPSPRSEFSSKASHLPVTPERLTDALHCGEFVAYFQPKVTCANGELAGFESLARWPQKDGSMIAPDLFIGVAEQTGLIHDLTRQIYDYALSNLPDLARVSGLKFALNLSPVNLNDETFPHWLVNKCDAYGVMPSQVVLELTETASINNPLSLLEKLTQFRIRGFHLSIDDFGVGYSSLVQLARLPFSELKIDQMFVKTLSESEESRKIVSAIVGLSNSLDLKVVAEGVEDEWALDFLRDIGCDEAQGYFIAKPMDKLAAIAWKDALWVNTT